MSSKSRTFWIYNPMRRIEEKFAELKKKKKKALIVFMTAGDPNLKKNEELVYALEKEGVDLIELGVPFSDPLADGAVIQASSQRSLKRGTTLKKVLALVKKIRTRSQIPLVFMSYLNPIWRYGLERFAVQAKKAGLDGVVVPDLPPEEGQEISSVMKDHGLDLIYLLAPTSNAARQKKVSRASTGFVYYVSLTGVTGSKNTYPAEISKQVEAIKKVSRVPVCVGFGVSTPKDARLVAKSADGVIIGSAVVRALHDHKSVSAKKFAEKFIRPFVRALGKDL